MHATTASPAAPARRAPLLINRPYALLWLGQTVSALGDMLFATTLALWIALALARGQPWAPLAVSGAFLAATLPDLLVGPPAGVWVDRWEPRATLLRADALRGALIALLLAASGLLPVGPALPVPLRLGAVYATVFLAGCAAQFFSPARMRLIAVIVPTELRARASALSQTAAGISLLLAPPLAGALYLTFGPGWAIGLDAASFGASWLAIRAVAAPPAPPAPDADRPHRFGAEFREGLRYLVGNQTLRTVLIAGALAMLGAGALNALDYFFLTGNLHAEPRLYGPLSACAGAGLLAGALLASAITARLGLARTFWLSLLALGALIVVYSRLTSFVPAALLMLVLGIPNAALNVSVGPLALQATPPALLGRVFAVIQPALSLASLLSLGLAGLLDSTLARGLHIHALGVTWGPVDTIFGGAALLIMGAGCYAWRQLRSADEPAHAPAASVPTDAGADLDGAAIGARP